MGWNPIKDIKNFGRKIDDEIFQPISDLGSKIDDEIFQPIKTTAEAVLDDPKAMLAVAAMFVPGVGPAIGSYLTSALGVTAATAGVSAATMASINAAIGSTLINTVANGGDFEKAVKTTAASYLGAQAGSYMGELAGDLGANKDFAQLATNVTGQAAAAAINGQDVGQAIQGALISSGAEFAVKQIPRFDKLTSQQKNAVMFAAQNAAQGKDPSQIVQSMVQGAAVGYAVSSIPGLDRYSTIPGTQVNAQQFIATLINDKLAGKPLEQTLINYAVSEAQREFKQTVVQKINGSTTVKTFVPSEGVVDREMTTEELDKLYNAPTEDRNKVAYEIENSARVAADQAYEADQQATFTDKAFTDTQELVDMVQNAGVDLPEDVASLLMGKSESYVEDFLQDFDEGIAAARDMFTEQLGYEPTQEELLEVIGFDPSNSSSLKSPTQFASLVDKKITSTDEFTDLFEAAVGRPPSSEEFNSLYSQDAPEYDSAKIALQTQKAQSSLEKAGIEDDGMLAFELALRNPNASDPARTYALIYEKFDAEGIPADKDTLLGLNSLTEANRYIKAHEAKYTSAAEAAAMYKKETGKTAQPDALQDYIGKLEVDVRSLIDAGYTSRTEATELYNQIFGRNPTASELSQFAGLSEADASAALQKSYDELYPATSPPVEPEPVVEESAIEEPTEPVVEEPVVEDLIEGLEPTPEPEPAVDELVVEEPVYDYGEQPAEEPTFEDLIKEIEPEPEPEAPVYDYGEPPAEEPEEDVPEMVITAPRPNPVYDYGEPNPEYDISGEGEIYTNYFDELGNEFLPDGTPVYDYGEPEPGAPVTPIPPVPPAPPVRPVPVRPPTPPARPATPPGTDMASLLSLLGMVSGGQQGAVAAPPQPQVVEAGPGFDISDALNTGFFSGFQAKKEQQNQQQPTKIAAGGYIDDLLAEGMSVDDLMNLLR